MHHLRTHCLAGVLAALLTSATGELRAQSTADSLAIIRVLGTNLPADARAILHSWACGSPERPCRPPHADTVPELLVGEIAGVAGVRLISRADGPLPCPWGYDPPRPDAGLVVTLAAIRWGDPAGAAYVLVGNHCDNPPGYLHDIFSRTDEYAFVREARGQWRLLWKRARSIT
jgi:hypothetical protein